jgi:hypothetical protein
MTVADVMADSFRADLKGVAEKRKSSQVEMARMGRCPVSFD